MKKEDLKILSYLAGFHLKKPDYDFKSKTGKLFNYVSEVTDIDFEILDFEPNLILLRPKDKNIKYFQFRFDRHAIIYEDTAENFEGFKTKALKILHHWQEINASARRLRLAGILRQIIFTEEKPLGVHDSILFDNYIKNIKVGGKNKQITVLVNYDYTRKGSDYNINLTLEELMGKKYSLECKLDINQIDSDGSKKIDNDKVEDIFNFSEKYYNEEFFSDLNLD